MTAQLYTFTGSPVAVGNFNVIGGSIDLMGVSGAVDYFSALCQGTATGHCVDLSGDNPGTLQSNAVDLPAGSYTLSFTLNGTGAARPLWSPNEAAATVTVTSDENGNVFTQTYTYINTDLNVIAVPINTAIALHNVRITFTEQNPPLVQSPNPSDPNIQRIINATGLILDNVTLSDLNDPTIPEPSTVFGGLLVLPLIWAARKRLKA